MASDYPDTSSVGLKGSGIFQPAVFWKKFKRSRERAQLKRLVRESGLFDLQFYLNANPDVARSAVDPLNHYLDSGGIERRDPHPAFDSAFYMESYRDVRESGCNPLIHFLLYGKAEGRYQNALEPFLREAPEALRSSLIVYRDLIIEAKLRAGTEGINVVDLPAIFGTERPDRLLCRRMLAAGLLKGKGIEIGALHNPLPLPVSAKVSYLDRYSKEGLYEHYPELRELPLVDVDIIDNGETLGTLGKGVTDFVIANHFLEHAQDPIATLKQFARVTRPGGLLFIAIPEMSDTFDRNREATSLEHLIRDHREGAAVSRHGHFIEWVTLIEPFFDRAYDSQEKIEARVKELEEMDYSIHFHCWTPESFRQFLGYCMDVEKIPVKIKFMCSSPGEIIVILSVQ